MDLINIASQVIKIEANEIQALANKLTTDFTHAVTDIAKSKGKLIVTGMGKSGIIAQKISATFASTGVPSFFMHPGEAFHGDLGMVESQDIVLLLSNSGETDELLKLIPYFKDNQNTTISMTGNAQSTLAVNTNYHIDVSIEHEACPLQLAPTSSTTAALVMGDCLAVALMELNQFKAENFARFHPGGSLGKRLLTTVASVMEKEQLPVCDTLTSMTDLIHIISAGRKGLVVVVEKGVEGIVTDGDIRRAMEDKHSKFFTLKAIDLMKRNPKSVTSNTKLAKAEQIMKENKINSLLVIEDNVLLGVVQLYDLDK